MAVQLRPSPPTLYYERLMRVAPGCYFEQEEDEPTLTHDHAASWLVKKKHDPSRQSPQKTVTFERLNEP